MRRNRIIWLVLYIMSIVAISFYGGAVSFGSFITLTAVPVVSLLYILLVIICFRIYQKLDSRQLTANQRSDFYFTLQNESLIAFSGIRVSFYSDHSTIDGLDDQTEYELVPHSGIRRRTGLICRYRGEYEVGIRTIIVTDFLRLFSISYKNKEPLRVRVKPDIVTLDSLGSVTENPKSIKDSRTSVSEPDVLVTEYTPGDDRRMIHWRASAASGKLMVRRRIGQQRSGVAVIMDPLRVSEDPEVYIPVENKMLEEAIALTLYYCSRNVQVSFFGRDVVSETDNMTQFEEFYEQMSAYDFKSGADLTAFRQEALMRPEIIGKTDVYYLTYSWDEGAALFTREFQKQNRTVTVFVTNDERSDYPETPADNIIWIGATDDLKEVLQ